MKRQIAITRIGLAICLLVSATLLSGHADPRSKTARSPLRIGAFTLRPCGSLDAYCGSLDRPLDPTGDIPGRIGIHFEYYPHSAPGKAAGVLVATEGGPGYPATESRDEYLALFQPLRDHRDVLIMDNRGTGHSGAVDCRSLQTAPKWTVELMGECGRSLGAGAPLYSTAYAADDLAAILKALGVERIDLYGDSYGTYFEQVYAVLHPDTLRSIVLDGAYPLYGPDYPWYPTYAPAMREKFNRACRRSTACAKLPGSSIDHMRPALQELRAHPFSAHSQDSDGKQLNFTANASLLATVMFGSAPAYATVREFDASARAFADGDRLPLLRLMAETLSGVDSRDPTADATKWSAGLAAAVTCQDAPQIFNMNLDPAARALERDRVIAERQATHPDTYAPFSFDEYRGLPLDYSFIDQCVTWPAPPPSHPPSIVVPPNAPYPAVPALILSGDLDNMTTMADGAAAAKAFPNGMQLIIANGFHVNALPHSRSSCGAAIVHRFITSLQPGDTRCAQDVPPVRLLPQFARRSTELDPASALPGNQADPEQLRMANAALFTVADVLTRVKNNSSEHGAGLRGGDFKIATQGARVRVTLSQIRWTEDLAVSGSIDAPTGRTGVVHASLHLVAASGQTGEISVGWPEGTVDSTAQMQGAMQGRPLLASAPAP